MTFDTYIVNINDKINKTTDRLDFVGITGYIPLAVDPATENKFNLSPFTNSKQKDNFYFQKFLPHYEAWSLVEDKPLLIIESGVMANTTLPLNVSDTYNDVLSFSHGESHYEPVIETLEKTHRYSENFLDYYNSCLSNSHAYIIKPHAVKVLLEFCRTRGWMLPHLMLNSIVLDIKYTSNKQFIMT